jgi:hypothetical protein
MMSFSAFSSKTQKRTGRAIGIGLIGVAALSWWFAYRSFSTGSPIIGVLAVLGGLVLGLLGLLILALAL